MKEKRKELVIISRMDGRATGPRSVCPAGWFAPHDVLQMPVERTRPQGSWGHWAESPCVGRDARPALAHLHAAPAPTSTARLPFLRRALRMPLGPSAKKRNAGLPGSPKGLEAALGVLDLLSVLISSPLSLPGFCSSRVFCP